MRSYPTIAIRVPPALRDWLKQRAQDNARSLTGEATWLLDQQRKKEQEAGNAKPS